jgi:hypothetical protein
MTIGGKQTEIELKDNRESLGTIATAFASSSVCDRSKTKASSRSTIFQWRTAMACRMIEIVFSFDTTGSMYPCLTIPLP